MYDKTAVADGFYAGAQGKGSPSNKNKKGGANGVDQAKGTAFYPKSDGDASSTRADDEEFWALRPSIKLDVEDADGDNFTF